MTHKRSERKRKADDGARINRREYVLALSAASAGLLAGCQSGGDGGSGGDGDGGDGDGGDGDGGDGGGSDGGGGDGGDGGDGGMELGERVPRLDLGWTAGLGDTSEMQEASAPIMQQNLESIGVQSQFKPIEAFTLWADFYSDQRNLHAYGVSGLGTPRNDPWDIASGDHIERAGPVGGSSSHWANCEATMIIEELAVATSREEQRELTHEFMRIWSEELVDIPMFERVDWGAYRTDIITEIDYGFGGVKRDNPEFVFTVETVDDTPMVINANTSTLRTNKPHLVTNTSLTQWWDAIFYEPLMGYTPDFELHTRLASDWEHEEFTTYTFELRENAVFHDGEPITAEDVKWTFEFINENVQDRNFWPYVEDEPIEVVDDHTVRFHFTQPTASWIVSTATLHGIFPKHVWVEAGAEEDPEGFDLPTDPYVGSGPYELTGYTEGQFMRGDPFDDHWIEAKAPVEFQGFQDQQTMARAFKQGELNIFPGMAPAIAQDIAELENAEVVPANSTSYVVFVMHNARPPIKFPEFKHAWSWSLDRQQMSDVAAFGEPEPVLYGVPNGLNEPHWTYPENPDDVLTKIGVPEGDSEQARQILEDAGWGWDDQGRLHYPPDADLEPLWPKGESPRNYPDRWPCVEELGLEPPE